MDDLRELFRSGPGEWREAWSRAQKVGPPLASVLWDRAVREGHPKRRLLWIAAFSAAAGNGGSQQMLSPAWLRDKGRYREQILAVMALAIGSDPMPAPRLGDVVREGGSDALRVAACAAWARTASAPLSEAWPAAPRVADPGLCAAALLAGSPLPSGAVDRWIDAAESPSVAAQLVWRALFLAPFASPVPPERRLEFAQWAVRQSSESAQDMRRAAAVYLARIGVGLSSSARSPSVDLLVLLGSSPDGRRFAYRSGWLSAEPPARYEPAVRAKLALLFVQVADPEEVFEAAQQWANDEDLRAAVCLGAAWRYLAGDAGLKPGPWLEAFDAVGEHPWLRLAMAAPGEGDSLERAIRASGHPVLELALAGKLTDEVMAREIERELWRRDIHPGRDVFRCWAALVRDLLLSGSDYGRAVDGSASAYPYLPSDLQPGDRDFFEVATEFLRWAVERGAEMPVGYELR